MTELTEGMKRVDGRGKSQKVSGKDFVEFEENVVNGNVENPSVID